ncbi:hypothetical protein BT96DRAFT_713238 [Gymnopus androsaceus JB14]|uniref:Uncharacterized protein n=1 Tax=Gymnopus androsaceus JB14 TaxID=1447944 RepID=A0A6A4HPZ4_9AGAR|nr:hypothetical protein BT96DRAFT_713238 [Gymnopus androsaceus JB14]
MFIWEKMLIWLMKMSYDSEIAILKNNDEALDRLIGTLKDALSSELQLREVGFPLRHLYRQQSILPQYLKGVDALIYQRLTEASSPFYVSLFHTECRIGPKRFGMVCNEMPCHRTRVEIEIAQGWCS